MSRYTVQRKLKLARMRKRAQPGNEAPVDWLPPDPDAVEVMMRVDVMSKRWRGLVNEFGLLIVEAHVAEQYRLRDAFMSLTQWRETKQREYATPFPSKGRIVTHGRR